MEQAENTERSLKTLTPVQSNAAITSAFIKPIHFQFCSTLCLLLKSSWLAAVLRCIILKSVPNKFPF